ncbi:retrovirus-related pol polyprotein from transposon TNT 1-94 [Tanacetum coccineum]|uniref:Retrovirus-related pol polyprotein from transposon TNT 1-94 n=1 Tax=Tanacetum coccineum TaxID=301880 RepID=A0ABQ4YPP2_9ASTR
MSTKSYRHHNVLFSPQHHPTIWNFPTADQHQQLKFSQPTQSVVLCSRKDDPIDAINHMMSFLTAVWETNYLIAGTTRKYTPGASGSNTWKQRTVICYNCKGEGHIAKQCTKPKRKRDETWFNDKVLLVRAQASGQALTKEEIAFLADPGLPDIQNALRHPHPQLCLSTMIWMLDSECDELNSSPRLLLWRICPGMAQMHSLRSNEQYAEIVRLKQNLFEQVQEKDSLMKTVSDLKNDLKMEENRNIDREIALEKKIKQLDNIIFKRGQSAQTVHMMTKSKICYDHSTKHAIGFEKPFYLKKARESKPKLYDGNTILKMDTIVIPILIRNLYDSINKRVQSKEQCDALIKQVNIKSGEISDLNAKLQEQGVRLSTSASGSHPSGNTRNDRIPQTPSSNSKNKNSKKQDDSDYVCVNRNACPLTRITTTNEVPSRKPIVLESESPKPMVKVDTQENLGRIRILSPLAKLRSSKSSSGIWILIGNVTISRVYYVEGLGHNLFSVGQFCDSNLEVAFRQHTCFIRNLEGVDLLTGSRGDNLYTLSLGNMMASSPFVYCQKHLKLSPGYGIVSSISLEFWQKSSKKPQKPIEDTNRENSILLHRIYNGPIRVASVQWKEVHPCLITLREYYEKVGISHETSVARSPQQNGVVERRNRTLIEAARTMLIYAKAPLFLWAEAVATTCYTQNRSMIRRRHGKTPYELLHDKPPDLSYLHVFGALCYPTNDSENLGKLQPKADIGIFIGYAPTKKAFRIYNRRTRRIIETIHVDFDELTAMASEHSSSGPALHEMTPINQFRTRSKPSFFNTICTTFEI